MSLPPRKYFSEITLVLNTRNALAIQPDQLVSGKEIPKEAAAIIEKCHIYLICRRPGLTFCPHDFEYGAPFSKGTFVRKIDGVEERHSFAFPMINAAGGDVSVGTYPHKEVIGYDKIGEAVVGWPTQISFKARLEDRSLNDYEVLYVGQAFGDGTRTAFERLQSHKTLQKILAETQSNRPDDEILLLMFEYEPAKLYINMDGKNKDVLHEDQEDTDHVRDVVNNPLSEKEEIGIAEAGLIWYFRPEYNEKFKNSQPHEKIKTLKALYSLDFNGLVVEINCEEFPLRLWSPERAAGHHHIAKFDLHDPKTRRTFFSLVDGEGQMAIMDESGPAY